MTVVGERIVKDLHRRGVRLSAKGDRLVVDAPKGVLTDGDRAVLRNQKKTIIEMLAAPDGDRSRTGRLLRLPRVSFLDQCLRHDRLRQVPPPGVARSRGRVD